MRRAVAAWNQRSLRGAVALTGLPSTVLCAAPALRECHRTAVSYPTPAVRQRRTKKKKYNFLTTSRLVPVVRKRESRAVIRQRDDVGLRHRQEYRLQLQRDIEEKIHYFPPYLENYVFYPKVRNLNKRKIFTGNRVLAVRTFTRVYVYVMDQLLKKDKRKALLELVSSCEQGTLPSTALKPYLDPRTGDITKLGILYSQWMRRRLQDAYVRLDDIVTGRASHRTLTPTLAYLARYHDDLQRVPSLQQWSHAIGPLRQDELVEFSTSYVNVHRAMIHAKREVESYGKSLVEQRVQELTMQEESELVQYVKHHAKSLTESMRRAHLTSSYVLCALNSLPEIRAIQTPARVFSQEEACKWAIAHGGSYSPPCPSQKALWSTLPAEKKATYFCFKRKFERRTHTGSQLYTRYCARDYGISKSDALRSFAQLSDLQQSAINFPFFYSIAPKKGNAAAFRHFYLAMCQRYGLTRGTGNNTFGNRLFEAAMRKKWNEMAADERDQYFESDAIRAAFPLLPPSSDARVTRRAESTTPSRAVDDTTEEEEAEEEAQEENDEAGGGDSRGDECDDDEELAITAELAVHNAKPVARRRERTKAREYAFQAITSATTDAGKAASRLPSTDRESRFLYASSRADANANESLDGEAAAATVPTPRRTRITV